MKKLLISTLALSMALFMVACGSEDASVENDTILQGADMVSTEESIEMSTKASAEESVEVSEESSATSVVYDGGYDLFFAKSTPLSTGTELLSMNMFNQAGLNPNNDWWGDPESRVIAGNQSIYMKHLILIENAWKDTYGFSTSQSFVCGKPYFEWYNDNNAETPALAIKKPEGAEDYYTLIICTPLCVDAAKTIGWTFDENDEVVCREAMACLLSVFSTEPIMLTDTIIEDLYGEKTISDSEFTVVGDANVKFDSSSHSLMPEKCYSVYYIKAK